MYAQCVMQNIRTCDCTFQKDSSQLQQHSPYITRTGFRDTSYVPLYIPRRYIHHTFD